MHIVRLWSLVTDYKYIWAAKTDDQHFRLKYKHTEFSNFPVKELKGADLLAKCLAVWGGVQRINWSLKMACLFSAMKEGKWK